MNGVSAAAATLVLKELGFTDVVSIPDGESRLLHRALETDATLAIYTPTREGEGIALAAGIWVGGRRPLVLLQNTGLMEAGDALRGCGIGPRIPLVLLVGWRGYTGAMEGKLPIDSAYPYTLPILDAWGISHREMMSDDDLGAMGEMAREAAETRRPTAVVYGYPFRP